jgi:phospholipase C
MSPCLSPRPAQPGEPFSLAQFIPPTEVGGSPVHEFYREQHQINGGKMTKFVAWTDVGGLVMSYYDATNWPMGRLAQQFTLADNFFHAAFGGSFLNHMYLVCACAPVWRDAPADQRAQLDAAGFLVRDGRVTPDRFVVNTSFTVNTPHPASAEPKTLVPNQTQPTIGDRLSQKGISWAWYAGGWRDALAGRPDRLFQFHHQPFAFYANYADGTAAKAEHLRDEDDFFRDLASGNLPAVVVAYEKQSSFGVSDCSRAIQSMMLTAWADGVGSNWVGFGGLKRVAREVGVPDGYEVLAVVPFGYPRRAIGKGKKRRKPLSEVASAEKFGTPFS